MLMYLQLPLHKHTRQGRLFQGSCKCTVPEMLVHFTAKAFAMSCVTVDELVVFIIKC